MSLTNELIKFAEFKKKDPLYQAIEKLDEYFEWRIWCIDYMNQLFRLEHLARQNLLPN